MFLLPFLLFFVQFSMHIVDTFICTFRDQLHCLAHGLVLSIHLVLEMCCQCIEQSRILDAHFVFGALDFRLFRLRLSLFREKLDPPGKKSVDFPGGATPSRTPPSGPAGASRVGVIARGGIVDPFWNEEIFF